MKTELAVLGMRLNMETRARRRGFVIAAYIGFAVFVVTGVYINTLYALGLVLATAAGIGFSSLTGDNHGKGDEREEHVLDHAHRLAYRWLGFPLILALFAGYFRGPNPIAPLLEPVLREVLRQLPYAMLWAAGVLYITLPQAILLWTEPDMEESR